MPGKKIPADDLELLRRGYEAFGSNDVESTLALIHPDIEIVVLTERLDRARDVYLGREGFLANIAELTDVFEDFRIEPREFQQEGERILAAVRVTGRGKASGAAIDAPIFHVWTLDGGLARRLEIYSQREDALKALRS